MRDPFFPDRVNKLAQSLVSDLQAIADADIVFPRIAVTEEQSTDWDLPTRPTKTSDTRARAFGSDLSVELDAIEPNQLRALVEETIEVHLRAEQFKALKAAEESERDIITRMVGNIARTRRR